MANVVGDIAIQIGADIGPLVRDLGKAQAQVSKFGAAAEASAGGMAAWSKAGKLLGSGVATVALGLVALTKTAIDNAGALHDASIKTGVHVAQLQAMSQVADEASVSSESLYSSLSKMQKNIAGLQSGTQAQVDAFHSLGLTMSALQGLSPDQQFEKVAQAISGIQDPAQRTAAAMDIFGKSGADLLPMMDGYSAALADVAQKQRDLGIAMTDEQAAKLDDLGDAMGRLSMAAQGLGNQLAITFGPAIAFEIEGLTILLQKFHDAVETTKTEKMFDNVSASAEMAAGMAEKFALSFSGLADGRLSQELNNEAAGIRMMTDSFKAGGMTAEEYRIRVSSAFERIKALITAIGELNGTDLSDAIAEMERYVASILDAVGAATTLNNIKIGASASSSSGGLTLVPDSPDGSTGGVSPGTTAPATVVVKGGGGGGGKSLADDLKSFQEQFMTKSELADATYADQLKKIEDFRKAGLLKGKEYDDLELKAAKDHHDAIAKINQDALQVKLSEVSGAFGDLSSLMQSHNKKLFNIGKAAALAQAVVDGYSAATSAWDKGMKIGGPPVAAAFTAMSLVKTGALIASIKSTQFGGGGGGATSSGSGSASVGSASAPAAAASPANVNISWFGGMTAESMGSLTQKLNAEFKQGYRLNLAIGAV